MTKAQQKRYVQAIRSKAMKLYMVSNERVVTTADMNTIEKMCDKLMKRLS